MAAELTHAKDMQAGERVRAYVNNSSTAQPPGTDLLPIALSDPSDSMAGVPFVDQDFDSMLEQFQPQHWLTPASLPWDQWDTWIVNTAS